MSVVREVPPEWTEAYALRRLREALERRGGRRVAQVDLAAEGCPSAPTLRKLFGSVLEAWWRAENTPVPPVARRSFEVSPSGRPKEWTEESAAAALLARMLEQGDVPPNRRLFAEGLPSRPTLGRLFGSRVAAVDAAAALGAERGTPVDEDVVARCRRLSPNGGRPPDWTCENALPVLAAHLREHGRLPVNTLLAPHGLPSSATLRRLFGSRENALWATRAHLAEATPP